ncbi:hypothetical protein BCR33DRAFT_718901 [Rhizoclosmatium globosum]|uniref:Uncharacterized protein n=1 Tax=Rhizoclosmatium globosum TaxID=329046 RepID=A0A1Y2C2I5_9FUNG|nr:hypothetical protein BCR33DRAFT_718901 [Rhizoclosmatium globosum]|eukprot:ORY41252.1 hypothetical protein BCR33DRAFT_718901 [Rhizoclosmatium globosum]
MKAKTSFLGPTVAVAIPILILIALFVGHSSTFVARTYSSAPDVRKESRPSSTNSFCFPKLPDHVANHKNFSNVEVNVFVFYGRRENTLVLDRYLRRNSRANGGLINRVLFITNMAVTHNSENLSWIMELSYNHISDPNAIYLKIDDDIVFIEDGAIETMVYEVMSRKWAIVSGNVVGNFYFTHLHHRSGALRPYAVDYDDKGILHPGSQTKVSWRVKKLPSVEPHDALSLSDSKKRRLGLVPQKAGFNTLEGSPLAKARKNPWDDCAWKSVHCGAASHYSVFDAIEESDTNRYHFAMWDIHAEGYERFSINFLGFWGSLLVGQEVWSDDELYLSHKLPEKLRIHNGVNGRALVAHLGYFTQDGIRNLTDVLEKYDALSQEIEPTKLGELYC